MAGTYRSILTFLIMIIACNGSFAQHKITVEEYIMTYKDIAMEKMEIYRIPASITLAQGILESGIGNSELARKANNHFGIKCHKGWTGKTYHMDDDTKDECFRKYNDAEESYRDHSIFLTTRDRYAGLFDLDITDYKAWAGGLKKAGYATNPRYPQLLIKIIEENRLDKFDKGISPSYASSKEIDTGISSAYTNLPMPQPSNYELVEIWETGRKVYINNGVKFIFARAGDSWADIAADFEIYSWQLPKYNELDKKANPRQGQMIYIEKKKRKNKNVDTHTVRSGETMHDIAQVYGIQLTRLYRKNNIPQGINAEAGKVLKLH